MLTRVQRNTFAVLCRLSGPSLHWVPTRWVYRGGGHVLERMKAAGYIELRTDHRGRRWVRPKWYQPPLPLKGNQP
jgi:hypothetical protein